MKITNKNKRLRIDREGIHIDLLRESVYGGWYIRDTIVWPWPRFWRNDY